MRPTTLEVEPVLEPHGAAAPHSWLVLFACVALFLILLWKMMGEGRSRQLRTYAYIPFSEAVGKPEPVVFVGGSVSPSDYKFPTLTNHKSNRNPRTAGKEDTSTGLVLDTLKSFTAPMLANNHLLGQAGFWGYFFGGDSYRLSQCRFVTTNHWDIDSFLAVWAFCNRTMALEHESVLRHMARIGDFKEGCLTPEQVHEHGQLDGITNIRDCYTALKLCCAINTLERQLFSAPRLSKDVNAKMTYFFDTFGLALAHPENCWHDWQDEYKQVMAGFDQVLLSPDCSVQLIKKLGFSIIQCPDPLHYYSLFSHTLGTDVVLTLYDRNRYELECKYTQYVQLQSRPVQPRLDLAPLVHVLNVLEQGPQVTLKAVHASIPGKSLRNSRTLSSGGPLSAAAVEAARDADAAASAAAAAHQKANQHQHDPLAADANAAELGTAKAAHSTTAIPASLFPSPISLGNASLSTANLGAVNLGAANLGRASSGGFGGAGGAQYGSGASRTSSSGINEEQEEVSKREFVWVADHFLDKGPILRLEPMHAATTGHTMLSKTQRRGHPFERPFWSSCIPPEVLLAVVQSFLEFGLKGTHPKRGGWSWEELHAMNSALPMQTWVNAVLSQAASGEFDLPPTMTTAICGTGASTIMGPPSPSMPPAESPWGGHAVSLEPPKPIPPGLVPELQGGPSSIVTEEDVAALICGGALPNMYTTIGGASHPWRLIYCTRRDGISLSTLYRRAAHIAPTLLFVKDTGGAVFGAYASEAWRVGPRFYGSGQTCVFQLHPRRVLYPWKRPSGFDQGHRSHKDGSYFQFGTHSGLGVGGNTHFALWIDNDLFEGSSHDCDTFGSPQLSSSPDFHVHSLELWAL